MTWRDEAPEGKLDLLVALDFRMTSSTLLADLVLPAATWYEKHDLSSTDMHPFVHAFTPAIDPPWETRTDFDIFHRPRPAVQRAGPRPPRRPPRPGRQRRCSTTPRARRPSPAGGCGTGPPARSSRCPAGRCRGCPSSNATTAPSPTSWSRSARWSTRLGLTTKAVTVVPDQRGRASSRHSNGVMPAGAGDGRPALDTDAKMAEAILALSGTTNGRLAVEGFRRLEERTGRRLADLAEGSEEKRITFADTQARPVPVITSPEWSGSETGGRRYAPFTINVERLKPWHTLTGRMHFFLDHDWMSELGETLPTYRPPLDMHQLFGEPRARPRRRAAGDRSLPHPALEVVHPLRVPGQPAHAVALARRADAVDEPGGRGRDRGPRQRVGRGGQPQRRAGRPGDRLAPAAGRDWSSSTTPRSGW